MMSSVNVINQAMVMDLAKQEAIATRDSDISPKYAFIPSLRKMSEEEATFLLLNGGGYPVS